MFPNVLIFAAQLAHLSPFLLRTQNTIKFPKLVTSDGFFICLVGYGAVGPSQFVRLFGMYLVLPSNKFFMSSNWPVCHQAS